MGLITLRVAENRNWSFDDSVYLSPDLFPRARWKFRRKWPRALVKVAHKTEWTRDNVPLRVFHFKPGPDKSRNTMISRVSLHESRRPFRFLARDKRNARALGIFLFHPRGVHVSQGVNWKGRPGLFINDRARFHCASIFHARMGHVFYIEIAETFISLSPPLSFFLSFPLVR